MTSLTLCVLFNSRVYDILQVLHVVLALIYIFMLNLAPFLPIWEMIIAMFLI
jgi:hypothetical protein